MPSEPIMANGSPGDRLTTTRVLVPLLPGDLTRRVSSTRPRLERAKAREAKAKAKEEMVARVRAQASKEEGLRHRGRLPRLGALFVRVSTGRPNAPKTPSRKAKLQRLTRQGTLRWQRCAAFGAVRVRRRRGSALLAPLPG